MTQSYAHSGHNDDRSDWQRLDDHLSRTAALAAERAAPLGLAQSAGLAAELHDFGKNDPAFDRVLQGKPDRVDHSTAGGKLLCDRANGNTMIAAQILAHAILGHHAGLPDTTGGAAALSARLHGFADRIPPAVTAAARLDLLPAARELVAKCRQGQAPFDLSLAGRMVFSCLVDADYRDTEAFYDALDRRSRDRDWPALAAILPDLRHAFDRHMAGFAADGDLNRLRAGILSHIRAQAHRAPGLYTLTVPTGGGKTLASMGFALDHAAKHGHRRIIYAIPYTSIIDQTAQTFRNIFGDVVLEHHSAIDSDRPGEVSTISEGRQTLPEQKSKLRLAMEDWAAPIVVTTNVQLFESLFAARPSRCRKLHNIAGSVIILDEAQCLPRPLLLPTLRMIDALAAHYGCTIVLCTATQPAFDSAQLPQGLDLAGRELAPDPQALAQSLRRARIVPGGEMTDAALTEALLAAPQGLVIVNSRKHALALYRAVKTEGLEGALHLTTRQYPAHRRRIIAEVKDRLAQGQPCRLVATSLIEAGVDLDFPKAWRAEAGLDSVIQAAGRVNREGKRPLDASTLTIFTAPDNPAPAEVQNLAKAMHSTAAKFGHDALMATEAIRDWFGEVYWRAGGRLLDKAGIVGGFLAGPRGIDFKYRTAAEAYRMVEDTMVPVIIETNESAEAIRQLDIEQIPSGKIARALQPFTVQVPTRNRERLRQNGRGDFRAERLRGDQFFVLTDKDLYREDFGLWWEGAEELAEGQWLI